MSCLGVHFALSEEDAASLAAIENQEELLDYLVNKIEPDYFEGDAAYIAESGKAWDAIHRVLTNGYLTVTLDCYPLSHVILGGESLYNNDNYIISLKNTSQVQDIAKQLEKITEQDFRERYNKIPEDDYSEFLSDDDFLHTWDWFQGVKSLYLNAAKEGRVVVFTVDQ